MRYWVVLVILGMVTSCAKIEDAKDTPKTGGQAISSSTPFAIAIETKWEGDSIRNLKKVCEVPQGSTTVSHSCSLTLPEGELYHSSLIFTMKASGICEIVFFSPYYYRLSLNATFIPSWLTTAPDCTGTTVIPGIDCYDGVAPLIVPDFPTYRGFVLVPNGNVIENEWTVDTARSLKRLSNRMTANTLSSRTANLTLTASGVVIDQYIATRPLPFSSPTSPGMQDYDFLCTDRWLQPIYDIPLTISDDDVSSGNPFPDDSNYNHRADWNSALDPT